MNIERLEHLHIMGDASAYAHLMRERERRGERWCGGVNEPPPILALEELREWAEVEFFADGLTAVIEESDNTHKPTVYLRQIDSPFPNPVVGVCHVSADGRPRFRVFHAQKVAEQILRASVPASTSPGQGAASCSSSEYAVHGTAT